MSKFATILIVFCSLSANLFGDEITLTGGFLPYETYYIGAIDLGTGTSDVQIFNFLISGPAGETIEFNAQFTVEILAPELGFIEKTQLISINTKNPIQMKNPIYLDNRDFNINSTKIFDTNGNSVDISFEIDGEFDIAEYDDLLSAVVGMGRLPDGIYEFVLKLDEFSIAGQPAIIKTETINITTPTSLNLIYPGGVLSDTSQNIVYTPYPIFQWSTETCTSCKLFIRVAEFNPESHSSLDEAIEDVTSLPIDQVEGWELVETGTSFQYPLIGAGELEAGKLYAWQIKKELPTTLGTDAYLSPISVFKLVESSTSNQNNPTGTELSSNPILIALKDLLGEENFNTYFGTEGEFSDYLPNGTYRINNENTTSNDILQILDQLQQGTISVVNINVE